MKVMFTKKKMYFYNTWSNCQAGTPVPLTIFGGEVPSVNYSTLLQEFLYMLRVTTIETLFLLLRDDA